ncbi:hypothetical protein G210_1830 [Candida maltosa Xu316]|uniref:Cofilin n=1 Tax=Candida maltosa (strain Xu316) TaxID=1245528 RepID=M3JXN8_CANMX|nr:hypothetical protein G210_1830 [Candida maltosa Xu316]
MSRSVTVSDESKSVYDELKLGKKYKFIIYKLSEDKTQVVTDEASTEGEYAAFLKKLPENECRYAVYDFEYEAEGEEGKRSKLVLFTWSPESACVKDKMIFASSKDSLKDALSGVATEVQGTDFSEVDYESVLDKVTRVH